MKELMMKKIVTYVILASFAVVLTAGEVGAKSVLPKKNRTTVSEAENSSENSKSEKIPFWGNRGSKKYGENPSRNVSENSSGSVSRNTSGSVSGNVSEASSRNVSGNKTVRVPQNNVEKPKKGNPVTEFFSNLGKKKKSKQEVELPSEKASASSSLRSVENSSGIRSYGEPVEEKPPFAPSYGVDRTTEVVSDTNEIPDAVILEDVQPEMGERPNTVVTQNENSQNFQNTRNIQNVPSAQSVSETQNVTEMQAPLATDDIIILEDVPAIDAEKGISQSMAPPVWGEETTELPPSSDPILASPDNSVGQNVSQNISQNTVPNDGQGVNLGETQKTSQDILLETSQSDALDVAVTENDGILEDVEDAELPPVPSTISLPGMAPEEVSGHPEMSQNITSQNSQNSVQNALSRVQEPVYESDLDNWNQEIPTLEFMEKKNSLPLLNVSPQRLASPVGVVDETAGNTLGRRTPRTQNGSISGTQTHWNSGNSGNPADFSGNSVTLAEVKPRYGSAISEDSV
ncbi:MAG: hypothetical protein Q4C70_15780, partial [Planctomycetia bacterium]|nr:hypothetical protein [Planctomycetia bacterium]